MKRVRTLIYILVLLTFTGCGRKEVDYNVDDSQDNTGGSSDMSMDTISEEIGAEERWEEIIDEAVLKKVYAEVIIPETTGMKVIDVKQANYMRDSSAKENFINNITDGEVYCFLDDEDTSLDYMISESFEENSYILDYNDIKYAISFSGNSERSERIYFEPLNMEDLIEMENVNIGLYDESISSEQENKCSLRVEDAEEIAREFICDLDVGEFSCVDAKALKYIIYTNSNENGVVMTPDTECIEYYDGYTFRFVRSIDGVCVDGNYYGMSGNYSEQLYEAIAASNHYNAISEKCMEEIIIRVNDLGIVSMMYYSPMNIISVKAEDANLLSFDNVKASVAYEIEENESYKGICFTHMELTYFNYYDKELGNNCIIPVWRLTDKSMDVIFDDGTFSYIVVNALDGSVINVGEQQSADIQISE